MAELPALHKKVSILSALAYLPTASGGPFNMFTSHNGELSAAHFTAYFHQASIGTTFHQEHMAVLDKKLECSEKEDSCSQIKSIIERTKQALSYSPEKGMDLQKSIKDFFEKIPLPTVVCISILDSRYSNILGNIDDVSSPAWIFVSRFGFEGQLLVQLLPIASIFTGMSKDDFLRTASNPFDIFDLDKEDSTANDVSKKLDFGVQIHTTSETVVDIVAEEFRLVLEESSQSTSNSFPVETYEDRSKWWQWRSQLDYRLANLLRGIEDHWLGPWKCLLLGNPMDSKVNDILDKHLSNLISTLDMEGMHPKTRNDSLYQNALRVLLGSITSLKFGEFVKGVSFLFNDAYCTCLQNSKEFPNIFEDKYIKNSNISSTQLQLCISNFCIDCQRIAEHVLQALVSIFQELENLSNNSRGIFKISTNNSDNISEEMNGHMHSESVISQKALESNLSSFVDEIKRDPVILVLDSNSQVLPWESLPVLRNHEIYRMPSFGSILSVILCRGSLPNNLGEKSEKPLRRGKNRHEKCTKNDSNACVLNRSLELPVVDPSDAFYLLNPSGDLSKTQATFEQWFRDQKGWQGKTGAVPSQDEFMSALQAHDLFIYFGHGSGEQYLPGRTIKRLDCRAAAILMGCSSGRLSSRGDYEPVGVPLSYLMAGCPSIIANLWDVTDGDIDRFSKVLLNSWVTSVSNDTLNQEICEGLQNLRITGKRSSRKESQKDQDGEKLSIPVRIGSFIAEGRSKCKLPYLIGASPVCYGVPTIIKPKRT